MGRIADRVRKAFVQYKRGHLKAFVKELVDTADSSVHSYTHRCVLDREIEKQLKEFKAWLTYKDM